MALIFSTLLGIFIVMAIITNVPTYITPSDASAIRTMIGSDVESTRPQSFGEEISLIRLVQQKILAAAPTNSGIGEFQAREPEDLLRRRYGLCYDRSRAIDKALKFQGFKTRHVYILYSSGKSFLPALFTYRQPSHAVTEVLTSRGWLLVDSNSPWISLAKNGEPVSADRVSHRSTEFATIPESFNESFWVIRGLYSRKGFFYKPYLPFPDINWPDFLSANLE